MKWRFVQLLFGALLATGCVPAGPPGPGVLTPAELNAGARQFDGRDVEVQGFLTIAPEARNLYQSQALAREFERRWNSSDSTFNPKDYDRYCLTIANAKPVIAMLRALDGRTITVRGRFIEKYLDGNTIDLGACAQPTAIVIDADDLKRRYPALF